jgi:hypothetical protein
MSTDATASIIGQHPFPVQVLFGDERLRAYQPDAAGRTLGPGVQVATVTVERALGAGQQAVRAALLGAAQRLGVDFPYLLNLACQSTPERFTERLGSLAAEAGALAPDDLKMAAALKAAVDDAVAIGPQAIVRAAMAHLSSPAVPGGPAWGTLFSHVNHVLTRRGDNPRRARAEAPMSGVEDIAAEGLELWWVKEGSATIVFQVLVRLRDGRPPVRLALNVAKDLKVAAEELRLTYADFVALYALDRAYVMEPLALGAARITTWRGELVVPVLVAEWFDGHELHVYETGPQLHVWLDQRMGKDHPIPEPVSERIWAEMFRICARYTRETSRGLRPVWAHINAGDFIFRERPGGEWDVLLIWIRQPPLPDMPDEALVVTALLAGTKAFGADRDVTVWWDQPALALESLHAGFRQAGLSETRITALFRQALEGPFTTWASSPERIPWLPSAAPDEVGKLRGVFQRARQALEDHLANRPA